MFANKAEYQNQEIITKKVLESFPYSFEYTDLDGNNHNINIIGVPFSGGNPDTDWIQFNINNITKKRWRQTEENQAGRLVFNPGMDPKTGKQCLSLMGNSNYSDIKGLIGTTIPIIVKQANVAIHVHGINFAAEKMYERIYKNPLPSINVEKIKSGEYYIRPN